MTERAVIAGVVAAAVIVVLVVAGVVVYRVWYDQSPGALAGGRGVVRVVNPQRDGVPPPRKVVTGPYGATAALSLQDVDTSDGRPTAHLALVPASGQATFLTLHQGERATVSGITVQVLHIWQLPNPTHNAVDAQITFSD